MTGELELIQTIKALAVTRNAGVRIGIGDDCAALNVLKGQEVVVTTDFCLEGRHFRRDWHSPESAGHRCLARGLSDIAAMGARPVAAFLSLALPKGFSEAWFEGFMAGFESLGSDFGVELAGGDTCEAPGEEIIANVTVVGAIAKRNLYVYRALRRSGARVKDGIYVTGTLGGAAAELEALVEGKASESKFHKQMFPWPRVEVGATLARRGWTTSCIDLSDGFSTDLRHVCEASGVRAVIDLDKLPIAEGATLAQALHGGEDYELLFTAMRGVEVPRSLKGVRVTRIGTVVAGAGIGIKGGGELQPGGWEHFVPEKAQPAASLEAAVSVEQ